MYNASGYIEIVARAAEESMKAAVEEVKSLSHYKESGEVREITQTVYM